MITRVLVNGVETPAGIPVTDSSVLRGDGCFEVLMSYGGSAFAVEEHLDRLQRSAALLHLELPPRERVRDWVGEVATELGDGAVRIVVTRGSSIPGVEAEPLVVVFGHRWDPPVGPARLYPLVAPWHAAGVEWELAGAKTLSYAPNLAASRRAAMEGYDDALLLTVEGTILEGPTFSVAWVVDGVVETPALSLGILDSITRRVFLDLAATAGVEVVEGVWGLERLGEAGEVMALSTTREVQQVSAVGERTFGEGPVAPGLARLYAALASGNGGKSRYVGSP